jgi:hypothetical protein
MTVAQPSLAVWPHDAAINLPVTAGLGYQYLTGNGRVEAVGDGAGGVISFWDEYSAGVDNLRAQRVDAAGNRLWGDSGVLVATGSASEVIVFEVVSDGAGGATVAWVDRRGGTKDVYAQRLDANGNALWAPGGVAVCTAAGDQTEVRVASDGSSGAWIVWTDARGGASTDIYARRVNGAGTPQGVANGLAVCTAAGIQNQPRVAETLRGVLGCTIAWVDQRSDTGDIYAQRISDAGVPQWAANGVAICSATGGQSAPVILRDGGNGAVMAWTDGRSGTRLYAQHVRFDGTASWTANGVTVIGLSSVHDSPAIALDGAGGVVLAFRDYRSGTPDIYAQRLSLDTGTAVWGPNGVAVCTSLGWQMFPVVAADGSGGTYVAWYDLRLNDLGDIYVQRLTTGGNPQWSTDGVGASVSEGFEYGHTLVSAGAEGCIVQAAHSENGLPGQRVTVQKVDRWGYLGAEPVLTSVGDVPNDQGGRVKVSWDASPLDYDPLFNVISDYLVFRSAPAALVRTALQSGRITDRANEAATEADGQSPRLLRVVSPAGVTSYWEAIAVSNAAHLTSYSAVVPTTGDSVAGSNPLTAFMVQARGWSGTYWNSNELSGYSVDDLRPATPSPFGGVYAAGSTVLTWGAVADADLAHYRLYRGPLGFEPSPANRVAEPTTTGVVDAAGAPFAYQLTAVDVHGNESAPALLVPQGVASAEGPDARVNFLAAPRAQPVRAGADVNLRFGLAREGRARLSVHDVQGRRLATLLDADLPAGEHAATLPGGSLRPGFYLVRLASPDFDATRRLVVVR